MDRYVGHFLQAGGMPEICRDPTGLKAEQKVIALQCILSHVIDFPFV